MKHFVVKVKIDIRKCNIDHIEKYKVTEWNRLGQEKRKLVEAKHIGDLCYIDNRVMNAVNYMANTLTGITITRYTYAILDNVNDRLNCIKKASNNKEHYFQSHTKMNQFIRDNIENIDNNICVINCHYDKTNTEYDLLIFDIIFFTSREFIKFVTKPRSVDIIYNNRKIGREELFYIINNCQIKCILDKADKEELDIFYGPNIIFKEK